MSASGKPFPWFIWAFSALWLGIIAVVLLCAVKCEGQEIQQPPAPQQQLYIVLRPVSFPWIRYRVLGWGTPVDVYQPIGQPWGATVQPVAPYYPRVW